jgi:preprotein translocase subunit SecE
MSDNPKELDNPATNNPDGDAPAPATDVLERPATPVLTLSEGGVETREDEIVGAVPAQLGSARYVHAAFFAAATLTGYLAERLFTSLWSWLVECPFAVQHAPQLLRLSEDERGTVGSVVGVALGLWLLFYFYKRPQIRTWAEGVAGELTKVSWPDREAVTRGTVIVIVASLVATVYVTILDRLWGFATHLVYGS